MDWPQSTEPVLTVAPRGYQRPGGKLGPLDVIKENALEWKSRYGSMIVSVRQPGRPFWARCLLQCDAARAAQRARGRRQHAVDHAQRLGAIRRAVRGVRHLQHRVPDLANRRYFFELATTPNVIWAELDRFDLGDGAPARGLDPDDMSLCGDVSDQFKPAKIGF
jgi:penicillin V acylase-like amidase (Ntn superfamily)